MENNFVQPAKTSKLAIASLIIALISIPVPFLGLGFLSIVLGIIALFKIRKYALKGKTLAIVGIVFGLISIVMSFVLQSSSLFGFGLNALFDPHKFSVQKIETDKVVLNTDVQLITEYKNKNGKYPEKFSDIPNTYPSFYQLYYRLSNDGTSYVLRSNGPDELCGTSDDILPDNLAQPQNVDCVVELGNGVTTKTTTITNTSDEFQNLKIYSNKIFSIKYPPTWRVQENTPSLFEFNDPRISEVISIRLSKIDLKNTTSNLFTGAEIKVVAYPVTAIKVYSNDSGPLDHIIKNSMWSQDGTKITEVNFAGYKATSIEELSERNIQYVGQKIESKTIVFQKGDVIFTVGYSFDSKSPIKDSMETLLNSFSFSK